MNVNEQVNSILSEISSINDITGDMGLREDLGLDSLGLVMLMIEIEEQFQIELDADDMNPYMYETVDMVVDLVNKYKGERYGK